MEWDRLIISSTRCNTVVYASRTTSYVDTSKLRDRLTVIALLFNFTLIILDCFVN